MNGDGVMHSPTLPIASLMSDAVSGRQRNVGFDCDVVVNARHVEAELPMEVAAKAFEVTLHSQMLGVDNRPERRNGLLDVGAHLAIVES